jgi:hypothetical protein
MNRCGTPFFHRWGEEASKYRGAGGGEKQVSLKEMLEIKV